MSGVSGETALRRNVVKRRLLLAPSRGGALRAIGQVRARVEGAFGGTRGRCEKARELVVGDLGRRTRGYDE